LKASSSSRFGQSKQLAATVAVARCGFGHTTLAAGEGDRRVDVTDV